MLHIVKIPLIIQNDLQIVNQDKGNCKNNINSKVLMSVLNNIQCILAV
jgi:hypothetical protein